MLRIIQLTYEVAYLVTNLIKQQHVVIIKGNSTLYFNYGRHTISNLYFKNINDISQSRTVFPYTVIYSPQ